MSDGIVFRGVFFIYLTFLRESSNSGHEAPSLNMGSVCLFVFAVFLLCFFFFVSFCDRLSVLC